MKKIALGIDYYRSLFSGVIHYVTIWRCSGSGELLANENPVVIAEFWFKQS